MVPNTDDAWQDLMDSAFAKFPPGLKYAEFLSGLNALERQATLMGNMNYQIQNGGVDQWVSNGYALHIKEVITVLKIIAKHIVCRSDDASVEIVPASSALAKKLEEFSGHLDLNAEDGSGDYYTVGNWTEEYNDEDEDEDEDEDGNPNIRLANRLTDFYYEQNDVLMHEIRLYFTERVRNSLSQPSSDGAST